MTIAAAVPVPRAPPDTHRGRLFRKYLLLILSLVTLVLLVSSGINLYFSYQENRAALASLQHEKAIGAASRIEQYIRQVSQQLAYASLPQLDAADVEARRIEFLKLLRQAPEVTDIAQLDAAGREQIAVSRLGMDIVASGKDRSTEPAFQKARRGQPWYGPVYFRKETEPYMTVAVRSGGEKSPVTVAELNLKFIWDVVSRIKIGTQGKAYVVDGNGLLVADPDIGLVLRKTSLAGLAHVKAAVVMTAEDEIALVSKDLAGTPVLTSVAAIDPLDWKVFVEQPIAEVYAKLNASILRTGALLLAGLVISALAASALARSMVRPIRTLDEGARRIGTGDLEQNIVVRTGDELEGLANQFNRMTAQLRESYAGLERKVADRTAELTESLEHQTATSEVLKVIGSSVADTAPVFDKILDSCRQLFGSDSLMITLMGEDGLVHVAAFLGSDSGRARLKTIYPRPLAGTSVEQAFRTRHVVHQPDVLNGPDVPESSRDIARSLERNFSQMIAPMFWKGNGIGSIIVIGVPPRPFSLKEQALLQTFADQAVIAIENVRLFNETRVALERQTATAEVLRVMSNSPTDVQPVLDAVAERSGLLCHAEGSRVWLLEGDHLTAMTSYGSGYASEATPELLPLLGSSVAGRAFLEGRCVQVEDIVPLIETEYPDVRALQARYGFRTVLAVPMLRERVSVGVISLLRNEVRPFTPSEVNLIQTFADQAVIAIQNARLFHEIEDKSRQLEIANRHKSEFLANMSHELRTPLNAIIGFSEVLSEQMFGDVNEKQAEYLEDIHSSGQHLLTLINDVLDLSKIEAGRMELDLSCFDLGLLLDNSMTLVRERAQRQGLALTLDVGEGLEEWVADARKVKQVVVNLLSNAVKFTPAGGSVTVRARRVDVGGNAFSQVSVADTGVGIAPEEQAAVFEEFRQASGDYLRKAEGTGLGLSLAKRFAELHGGTIRIASERGHGAIFTVTLPLQVLEALS